jgi:hypothetical protein
MMRHAVPTQPGGPVADRPGRVGGAARGWPLPGRLLADRWANTWARWLARCEFSALFVQDLREPIRLTPRRGHEHR